MRKGFNSRFGAIAAAAGSAIGLGNIWRFPYVAGESGGGAFIFVYLLIILVVGLPMLISEFSLGRYTQKNVFGTFRKLAPGTKWDLIGVLGIISAYFVLSFYVVVSGWTFAFLIDAVKGTFMDMSPVEIKGSFEDLSQSTTRPLYYIAGFLGIVSIVVAMGIEKGIERFNKVLMPMLFAILIILCVNSFTLSGFQEGIEFIFKPDFSKINTRVALDALGQVFFSLSIGMGTMMTYGSYIRKEDNMLFTSTTVAIADVFIALLAGIAIFPAVFSFGIEPASGPELVFVTLPNIFGQMFGGYYLSILFFVLLFVAALTSAVSAMEVVIAFIVEELKIKRARAVALVAVTLLIMGSLCSLSQLPDSSLKIAGVSLFDFCNNGSSMYLMPIGGFFIVLFVGWKFSKNEMRRELSSDGRYKTIYYPFFMFIVKFVAPIAISIIFLFQLGLI